MSIQFPCPGCSQPIEVDAEHAGQRAQCPYCNRVVTVPAESTLPPRIEQARPVNLPGQQTAWPGASGLPPVPHPDARVLAARSWAGYALICTFLAIALTAVSIVLTLSYAWPEMTKLMQASENKVDQAGMNKVLSKTVQDHPWLAAPQISASFFAVVGLALAIVSFWQGYRGPRTWISLLACGAMVGCWCIGLLV